MKLKLPLTCLFILIFALVLYFGIASGPVENLKSGVQNSESPSISYLDILNNPEFSEGMLNAVRMGDQNKMQRLQKKAVEIGIAAKLDADQMALLEGVKGLDFMRFRARRALFIDDFESYFNLLKPIDELKSTYPEAADLFDKADALILDRDNKIIEIAKSLADGEDYQLYLQQARTQWIEKATQPAPSL